MSAVIISIIAVFSVIAVSISILHKKKNNAKKVMQRHGILQQQQALQEKRLQDKLNQQLLS